MYDVHDVSKKVIALTTFVSTHSSRLVMQGMGKLCIQQVALDDIHDQGLAVNSEELCEMQRYSVNGALVSSLPHRVRICM